MEISWSRPSRKNYYNLSSEVNQNRCHFNDTTLENKILAKLYSLPEVKLSDLYIDSLTNHKHGISMRIVQRPDKSTKYYIVDAGYDNDERFENYYNFYVWPEKMTIKVVDSYTGKLLTLSEWRKTRKPGAVIK